MRPPLLPPHDETWTLPDGYQARGSWFAPEQPPRGLLLYLHGIQSHGGWYRHSASLLARQGHVVLQPDRRGSGLNERDRGDVAGPQVWLDDLSALIEWAGTRFGPLPVGLVGVSWGGKLAAAYALAHPERVAGLLLIAPGIFPGVSVPLHERLRIAATWAAGGRTRFEIPLSDPGLFTGNPDGQRFVAEDPHRLTHATARFLVHSTRLDRQVRRARPGALTAVQASLLLASDDRIIDNAATRRWATRCGLRDITELDAGHTLEFETDPSAFLARVTAFGRAFPSRPG